MDGSDIEGAEAEYRIYVVGKRDDCASCMCTASTNVVVDVHELSVTNDLYLGLDRTDFGRTNPVVKVAGALIDPEPTGSSAYSWIECGICSFTGRTDQAQVRYFASDPDKASTSYLAEHLTVEAAIEDGDLTASATCTTNFTVVKVDVEIGVAEDEEEKKGLFLQYVPDTTNGLITVEGTNQMVSVALTCEPIDLPTNEVVTVTSSGPGELYERLAGGELVLITATNYPACELASHDFWLHAHGVSSSMRDGAISIMHETSRAKDVARYTCVSIDWIKASCDKLPGAGSFGSNPEVFEGPCVDFGQPDALPPHWWEPGTYRDPKSKALKIFFKYVKDANDKPGDFTVKFDAQVRPSDFAQICEMEWTQTAGPDAIEPSNVHGTHAEVENPKKTVLYKYRLTASYDTFSVPSEAWFMMPRAGGEISGWLAKEIPIAISRAHEWYDKVCSNCVLRGMAADEAKEFARGTAWRYIASCEFDYQGVAGDPTPRYSFTDADRPEGEVEGFMGKGQGNDFDEPSYATLSGIVVHRAKVNNLLFCVWARVLGYSTALALHGADVNAIMRGQWGDNDSSQAAIGFGGMLYDKSIAGENLAPLITTEKAKTMQTPDSADGLNDVNLWPNNKLAPDGFRFAPMSTDYDTLSKGDQSSSDRGS